MTGALLARRTQRERLLDAVRTLIVERLRPDLPPTSIDPDVSLFGTGLGLDSVDAIELIISVEATFGRRIPETEEARSILRSVSTLVDWLTIQEALP